MMTRRELRAGAVGLKGNEMNDNVGSVEVLKEALLGIARLTAPSQQWAAETKRTIHQLAVQAIATVEGRNPS